VPILRTPDERFAPLADFPYQPAFAQVGDDLRMAYVQAGPVDGPPVLLLHGEPTWAYLWRTVIPVLAEAGYRVIAPDLIGFGRSDKPTEVAAHSYARHVEWVRRLAFDALRLDRITLVGHDWGGLIGLRLVAEHPDSFVRVVATNTGLPTGEDRMPEVWWRFRRWIETADEIDVGQLVQGVSQVTLPDPVIAAYDAPFPDETFKAGVRALPLLVPTTVDDPATEPNRAAWRVLAQWHKPFLVAFSDGDPITGSVAPRLRETVPGAAGIDHPVLPGGHFLQEDCGEQLGRCIAAFVAAT
jgi:haloalkane dehalogenase